MNIVYDYQIFSKKEYGGVPRYFYELAKNIQDETNRAKIISPLFVCNYLDSDQSFVKGVKINRFPASGEIIKLFNYLLIKSPFFHYNHIDVYHETYYTRFSTCPKNALRVTTVYDLIHEKFPDDFSRLDAAKIAKKHSIEKADHVICISQNTKKDLLEYYEVSEDKVSVVYLGGERLAIKDEKLNVQRPYLLYVGSRAGYKNFFSLLKAFALSSQLRSKFSLVCFGGGKFNDNEKNLIASYKLTTSDVCHIQGDDKKLALYYSNASAFIYPSLYEGFGLPPLEAMNYGCPVICSNVSSIPEVVGDAAEMFIPDDIESIQDSLEKTLFDSKRLESLKYLGMKRAEKFSWRKCALETLDVYKKNI